MEWIVVIHIGWLLFLLGITRLIMLGNKPCPREEAGYTCRKEKGQKCECEK